MGEYRGGGWGGLGGRGGGRGAWGGDKGVYGGRWGVWEGDMGGIGGCWGALRGHLGGIWGDGVGSGAVTWRRSHVAVEKPSRGGSAARWRCRAVTPSRSDDVTQTRRDRSATTRWTGAIITSWRRGNGWKRTSRATNSSRPGSTTHTSMGPACNPCGRWPSRCGGGWGGYGGYGTDMGADMGGFGGI